MAQDAKTIIRMPALDSDTGASQLELTTTKAISGGLYSSARIVFVRDGMQTFELCGDFSEIIKRGDRSTRATQKAIYVFHEASFTPEAIEAIKVRVKAFYAAKAAA